MKRIIIIPVLFVLAMSLNANEGLVNGAIVEKAYSPAVKSTNGIELNAVGTYNNNDWNSLANVAAIWVTPVIKNGTQVTIYLKYVGTVVGGSIRYQFMGGFDTTKTFGTDIIPDGSGYATMTATWQGGFNTILLYLTSKHTNCTAVYVQGVSFTDANGVMYYKDLAQ